MDINIFKFDTLETITILVIILAIVVITYNFFYTKKLASHLEGFDMEFNYEPNIEAFQNLDLSSLKIKKKYKPIKMKKNIWIYWENMNGNKCPTFIKLCMDSIKKHYGKYNLVILNEQNIHKYLPNLRKDFDNLLIAQKVDYYRVALLYKYGGIWLDADVIAMNDIKPVFDKLDEGYDYVGFGCTGMSCTCVECNNGHFRPSNWVMASRPKGILMKVCLDKLNTKLDNRNNKDVQNDKTYHDYGKIILWQSLADLKPLGYDYFHYDARHDGTRDSNKQWIYSMNLFSTNDTKFIDEKSLFFVVIYNNEINADSNYHWVKTCRTCIMRTFIGLKHAVKKDY